MLLSHSLDQAANLESFSHNQQVHYTAFDIVAVEQVIAESALKH